LATGDHKQRKNRALGSLFYFLFPRFFFSIHFLLQRMNLAVVLALLLSVALVLAKKPFRESKGNKATAKLEEADEAIVQAATEKKVKAEMADEGEPDEEDEADSEEVSSAERNQADAHNRMMMKPGSWCCRTGCAKMKTCNAIKHPGNRKKCVSKVRCYGCPSYCSGRL